MRSKGSALSAQRPPRCSATSCYYSTPRRDTPRHAATRHDTPPPREARDCATQCCCRCRCQRYRPRLAAAAVTDLQHSMLSCRQSCVRARSKSKCLQETRFMPTRYEWKLQQVNVGQGQGISPVGHEKQGKIRNAQKKERKKELLRFFSSSQERVVADDSTYDEAFFLELPCGRRC